MSEFDQEAGSEEPGTSEEIVDETSDSEAAQEAGTEESTAEKDEEWVLPGRVKTAAELARHYRELEGQYTRTSQELSELRRLRDQQEAARHTSPKSEYGVEQFAQDLKQDPVGAVRKVASAELEPLKHELKKQQFQAEYSRYATTYSDFLDLEPTMTRIAQENLDMIKANDMQNDPRLLKILYLAARGANAGHTAEQAKEIGKKQGEAAAVKKTKAMVEGGSGSKGRSSKSFDDLSLEEMRRRIEAGEA